jgi:hypothetical protein
MPIASKTHAITIRMTEGSYNRLSAKYHQLRHLNITNFGT